VLADLLGLPSLAPPAPSPRARRELATEAVLQLLRAMAARQPILVVVEDLHWVDPSTLELLGRLIEEARAIPILVLLTFRPSFAPPWPARAHLTTVMLTPLTREHVETLATSVGGGKALPAEMLHQVVARSDGVPLYVEELTRAALESGPRSTWGGRESPPPVPATLSDALTARLDRLATAKPVAQIAAVIGRDFSLDLLRAVAPFDEATLVRQLERLVEAGLLLRGGASSHVYAFKHALVQEAAYGSLPKREQRRVHHQVAVALAEHFPQTVEARPELLAEHYTRAGLTEPAIRYWQRAGERAIERSANPEAVSHLTRGLALLRATPQTPARGELELKLHVSLAVPLAMVRGYAAPEVGPVLRGLMALYGHRGELARARAIGEQLLRVADRDHDTDLLLEAHAPLGWVSFHTGRFDEARAHLERAMALYDLKRHRDHLAIYGLDAGVYCTATSGLVLWLLGYPDRAIERTRAALELARATAYPINLALALHVGAVVHYLRREPALVRERAAEVITLCDEQEFPHYRAMAAMLAGAALTMQAGPTTADFAAGLAQMRRETAAFRALGVGLRSLDAVMLGSAYGKAARPADGLRLIDEALAAATTTEDRWCESELHRVRGDLLLGQGGEDLEAERCFRRALDLARKRKAASLELRAAMSLGRLGLTDDRAGARRRLVEVFGRFNEGFDTADLQDTRILLGARA
jgi:tetratricopeptide (TPR) repeat protein